MTYLATLGKVSMGVKLFNGTPGMPKNNCFHEKNILAMLKRLVSMATHNAILLNGGVHLTTLISGTRGII